MALKQEAVVFREGYDIGIGVAMATGSPVALGATGPITAPSVGTGGSGSFVFRRINSTEELETELGIGADVSTGIGLFSASASLDFSKKCKIQSSSLTVLVSAEERFAFQQMDSPALTEPAAALVKNGDTKQFSDQFGDYFVRGIRTGGRFFGVVRIDTRSEESKADLNAALSASYGLTVDGDVKLRLSDAIRKSDAKAEAFIAYDGGHISTRPTSSDPLVLLEQLFTAMGEWSNTVRNEPQAYAATLSPYVVALGPMPPNAVQIEHQRDILIRCAKLRSQTTDKLNLIDYMLDPQHQGEFGPSGEVDLPALQVALAGDLDAIAESASFAINNIDEACDTETYMRKIKGVPDFKLTPLPANLPKHVGKPSNAGADALVIELTLDGVMIAAGWRSAADLAGMLEDGKRNTLITCMGGYARIPVQNYFQGFDTETLVGKAGITVFLFKAGFADMPSLKGMSDDEQRNSLIVLNANHTNISIPRLQGMNNHELVQVGLGWYRR